MCYQAHSFVKKEKLYNSENIDTITNDERRQIEYVFQNNRNPTDKYWIILFIVILIFWILCWNYLFVCYEKIDIGSQDSTEVVHDITNYIDDSAHDEFPNINHLYVSVRWVFYIFTCNITFFNAIYETYGSTVATYLIWTNVVFCVFCIYCSSTAFHPGRVFLAQINYFGIILIANLIRYRVLGFLFASSIVREIFAVHIDYKIVLWMIPEAVWIVIWATKKSSKEYYDENDDDGSGKIIFHTYVNYVIVMHTVLIFIIELLMMFTIYVLNVHKLDRGSAMFYAILGGSCYLSLILFYFQLMVNACATSIAISYPVHSRISLLLRSSYIVGRYHFGTACYQATLIFPRLHAVLVANQTEFRDNSKFSTLDKFWVHQKIHNVSPIATAVLGKNHAGSIRHLLRLCDSNPSIVEHFQRFAEMCEYFLNLLVVVNSLIITVLWTQEAIIDPRFPMGTWQMIFIVMIGTYGYSKSFDAVLEAIWLHVDDEDTVSFS